MCRMGEDFNHLRLKYHGDADKLYDILQRECRYKCAKKLPHTLMCEGFVFPSTTLAEMCTSDDVAQVHASMVGSSYRVLDMTAGLGIDTFHFAERGCKVTAIELSTEAACALRHNAEALGVAANVSVIEDDSIRWLDKSTEHFDVIFIDPARRDDSGRHHSFSHCTPDITQSLSMIMSHCDRLIIKASPMIDISSAKKELGITRCKVAIIGTTKECKEVVIIASNDNDSLPAVDDEIECITIGCPVYSHKYSGHKVQYVNPIPGMYLMQPYPSVMKGTGGIVYGYDKLHPNTHLYLSQQPPAHFPGMIYRITDVYPFNKAVIKSFGKIFHRINVAARNFPLTAPELAKRLRIVEGGDYMAFGVTIYDNTRHLIITESGIQPGDLYVHHCAEP